ncbi:MAG: TraB/GumN family protein [Pseudomonadota bacterium]
MKINEKLFSFFSPEKELKTVWKIAKDGRAGFLAGSAHLFPYRLKKSLESYIQSTKVVLFEGPLDDQSMNRVVEQSLKVEEAATLYEALDDQTIGKIRKVAGHLFSKPDSLFLILSLTSRGQDPLLAHFKSRTPWMAFFQIWSNLLKERGWQHSVDLEAWQIAIQLGKEIIFLETIEEQIAGLAGIPLERFVHFFKKIDQWGEMFKNHADLYLQGEIEPLLAATTEFPSRCPAIVERRDPVMFERMKGYFARGEAIAFVGTSHIPGIQDRFRAEGYTIRQVTQAQE